MQNHYSFNVSKDGKHVFATAAHSCVDPHKAKTVARLLAEAFPEEKGFKVTCTYWSAHGESVTFDQQGPVHKEGTS